jgi:sulfatase maturation enzyme AslB (radical SAM superfamily)
MCSSQSSTWRIPFEKHIWKTPIKHTQLGEDTLEYLHDINNVRDLEVVQVFWGEPLMEKEHFRFLAFLVEQDLAKNIFLGYNSNLTIIPKFSSSEQEEYAWAKDIFDLWRRFREVELRPSIDGFWKVDEYIRVWSKWDDVMKNISIIKSKWLPNLHMSVSSTIQIDNILTYPEFLLCMILKDIDYKFSSQCFVMWPDYLCVQNLPTAIKKYIHMKFARFIEKHPVVDEKYGHFLDEILDFMDAEEMKTEIFKKYLLTTEKVDTFYKLKEGNHMVSLYHRLCWNK